MTRKELQKKQANAAIELIAAFNVQIDYRRSAPLTVERIIAYWDAVYRRYENKLEALMVEYYESNNIVPYERSTP